MVNQTVDQVLLQPQEPHHLHPQCEDRKTSGVHMRPITDQEALVEKLRLIHLLRHRLSHRIFVWRVKTL